MEYSKDLKFLSQRFANKLSGVNCPLSEKYSSSVYFDWLCDSKLSVILKWFITFVTASNVSTYDDSYVAANLSEQNTNIDRLLRNIEFVFTDANWKGLNTFLKEVCPYLTAADTGLENHCVLVESCKNVILQCELVRSSHCNAAVAALPIHNSSEKFIKSTVYNKQATDTIVCLLKSSLSLITTHGQSQYSDYQTNLLEQNACYVACNDKRARDCSLMVLVLTDMLEKYIAIKCHLNLSNSVQPVIYQSIDNCKLTLHEQQNLDVIRENICVKSEKYSALLAERQVYIQKMLQHGIQRIQLNKMLVKYHKFRTMIAKFLLNYGRNKRQLNNMRKQYENLKHLRDFIVTVETSVKYELQSKRMLLHALDVSFSSYGVKPLRMSNVAKVEEMNNATRHEVDCDLSVINSSVRKVAVISDIWDKCGHLTVPLIDRQYSNHAQQRYYEMLLSMDEYVTLYADSIHESKHVQHQTSGKYFQSFSKIFHNALSVDL